ncbi:Predicted dehydrogenase [Friedmanniella luteola]|uniref:Predicted dehydrogenase n=1 Tax=Friedmanniella luteola TaxID=546871 RepID=A0A1H1L963_9ACTN|nr:Gfo/Idh/MocA family oxidoreductase [Friedmanniella luteola]SDR71036.1 Predicted dehydrogenase [Friedmanniella luteola]
MTTHTAPRFPESLPAARTPDAGAAPPLRWGVMGTGWIAERFVASLQTHSSQRVVAVGSRSTGTAERFAGRFGIERAHPSYDALVADPAIDVVYVATPHNTHLDCALLALEAGRHTVVEKPLALNAEEARTIAEAAAARRLFCMEAHWTTFLPKYDVLQQVLDSGALGDIMAVVADFGEWFPPGHRIFRPELAGGPMHDLGTYLVSLVVTVLGHSPDQIVARGSRLDCGVAGQTAMVLSYGDRQAVLHTSILGNTPTSASLVGTTAGITIDGPFYQPGGFTLTTVDRDRSLRYEEPRSAHLGGLHYQAAEVARRIAGGETESPLRPLATSIATIAIMDEVRRLTGDLVAQERSTAAS